jgi:N-acetyl-1-D-myo-inositol-2-amino-2-deoxy-alpha-D-glucopyranoside deacetylase
MSIKPSLLAVFAHPDDESFSSGGTLAHYASLGVEVNLVCSTRGEAGKITDPNLTIDDLGRHREYELTEACKTLGINAPIFLGYRDSGRLERLRKDDPLSSINADPREIEAKVRLEIEQLQPQVMLSFDPHGGYDHPDHIVIHQAALAAFFSSGHLPHAPQRLFYTASPIEVMRTWVDAPGGPMTPGMTAEVYGVSEATIAFRHDVSRYETQKVAAIQWHGSQVGPSSRIGQLPPEYQEKMRQRRLTETFSLGGIRGPIPHWPLQGFFDGLSLDGPEFEHLK